MVAKREDNNELSNKNPKISVIIPMYNCEKLVYDVLDMFSCQTFSDFEVICVIDGAIDRTEEFVKKYCEKDHRFSYIYKHNDVTGAALNAGMDIARGRYIVFSDAEDEYSSDYLKKLYETSVKHDAQITNCMFYTCDTLTSGKNTINGFERELFEEDVVYSHSELSNLFEVIQPQVANKMFNAEFLKVNNIRFPETRIAEDLFFSYAGLSIAERILFTDECLLKYRFHTEPDSFRDNTWRYMHEIPHVLSLLYKWLKDHSLLDIHGDGYRKTVDSTLTFYGSQNVTPRFISEFAHMLNSEEPWDSMTDRQITGFLEKVFFAESFSNGASEPITPVDTNIKESDKDLSYTSNSFRNRIHTVGLLRQVLKDRYGRALYKLRSMPLASKDEENTNRYSDNYVPTKGVSETSAHGERLARRKLIVSFTSYPDRISFVPGVLESLYSQSLKPDRIVLWLAEEQFPGHEDDLPGKLVEDVIAGKIDLRWCDNLGSHKKYFYAMQEFPDDIIIIVDDDVHYHPDTIKTLYFKHLVYPGCVVGLYCKLLFFDDTNTIRPYKEWPVGICLNSPSMQLVPTGGNGVLYPPYSVDPCIFDKQAILSHCNYKGVICGDDLWLKAHAILLGTLVAEQEKRTVIHKAIDRSQEGTRTIGKLDVTGQTQHQRVLEFLLQRKGSFTDKTVRELLLEFKDAGVFLDRNSKTVIQRTYLQLMENLRSRINANEYMNTGTLKITTRSLKYNIIAFCNAMSYDDAEHSGLYIERLRDTFRLVPDIDSMTEDSLYVRALMDYSAILSDRIYMRFKSPGTYLQMLTNWKSFFRDHPECKQEYLDGYLAFVEEMQRFVCSKHCSGQDEVSRKCRNAAKEESKHLSVDPKPEN